MDLNAVRMFVAVVQAGSLSAAATRLAMPLPTLSRRIRDLERQLKVQLLERSVRGARLTDAGARLYEHAGRGIETLLEAEQVVVNDQAHLKGRLRLSLPPTFEPWWELLAAFQRRYPDIEIYLYTTERRVDLVEDGIDVALRVGAIVHEAMVARHLLSSRNILVASPQLVKRLGVPGHPDALHDLPCATWASRIDEQARWDLGGHVVEPRAVLATNDYEHLCRRALRGDVVTELPPFLAAAPIREKRLVRLLPQHPLPEWSLNLLYPPHRHQSTIVRTYLDFCQSFLPKIVQACTV
ncbi:LysR family transcriptional regulator [Bradyrhizobium septentrionale]|uniref:LysR family transcriptional regulator n=1 Tax=Bradyrhizobium septentrionale TaxID=1404411 RepID=A0A974A5S4_9BRAD|nr:LysR family transcriptional regulator [Bradyrhizobium septentrionale]UGY18161.1 LysR substrate-binding domain-containing protein [Bradyrhizobium septentrionale]UGY26862.1 LysR substrate-binding domain-containing protein [Bradyrhizobium septentrionale]